MARKPRVVVAHTRGDAAMAEALAAALGAPSRRIVEDAADGSPAPATAIVLVTPRLLASDWVWGEELAGWIARHRAGEAHVIPVLGRRAATAGTVLSGLPVAGSVALDAWDDLAEGARAAADEIAAVIAAPAVADAPPDVPVPTWPDETSRRNGERLAALYAWRAAEPGDEVERLITTARAQLRRGPVLRAGEFLGDGRWRLLAPIGHSATDSLWRAFDRSTGSTAALKVFHGPWTADDEAATRFLYGVRRLSGLEHPGVARLLDSGNDDGFVWIALEHPDGGSLRDAILGGRLRGTPALQAILEVGRALEHAHARAFVHGQVNPAHVRLTAEGTAQLVDFALARDPSDGGKASVFDPPEALEPTWQADPVGDAYSLAMTALFALHGAELPFWVLRDPGRLIDALPIVDPVRRVLRRATSWERDARFSTIAAFLQALLDDAAVVRGLADSARAQGRLAIAAEHYEALLAASAPSDADLGEDVELQTLLGELYLRMDRPEDAFGHLVAALGIATEVEPLFPLLRAVGERTGDWERVATALESEWSGRGPADRASIAAELATLYQDRLRDSARAARSWSRVLDDHRRPEEALRALRSLADLARAAEDWDGFIAWSRDLLGFLPADERPTVQHAIGETFLVHKNDEQNGLLWIDRAASGGYHPMSIAKTLEEIRARRGEWPQAIALMRAQAADQTAAQAVRTLLRAAHIARSVNLEAEAAQIWGMLLERVPDHHLALRNLARNQFRAGHHAEALPLYEKLCAVVHGKAAEQPESSERANDNVSCARLLLQVGREEDALVRLEEALRLEPRHAPALHFAAPLHLARGDTTRARTVYERLLWTFRTEDRLDAQTEACLGLGDIEWIEGKLADAAAWYLRAVEFAPDSVEGWWGLARVALAARGGHPGAERAPWLRAAPRMFTPHEALARLLMGVVDVAAAKRWLEGDPMGRGVLAGGDAGARVVCAVVDLLLRRRLLGPALFARLGAVAGWDRQVEAVRHVWFEPADTDDSFPVHTSYAWARRALKDDFDPQGARPVLQAAPPGGGAADQARFDVLFAGKAPPAPDQAAVPPESPGKEHAAAAAPVVALVETPWLRLSLGRDQEAAILGSSPSCTCTLAREGVAPEHALVFRAGANVYVRALGGETLVDGEQIEARRLVGGEDLALGPVRLRVRFLAATESLPQPEPKPEPEPEAAPAREPEIVAAPEPIVVKEPEPEPIPESSLPVVPEKTDELPVEPTAVEPTPAWATEEEEVTIPTLAAPPPIVVPPPRGPTPLPLPPREAAPPPAVVARLAQPKAAPPPVPAAPPRKKADRAGVLTGLSGPAKGLEGQIGELLVVGRAKACGLRITGDNKLSGEHFRIERRDEGWILVDTDSSNGTVVNGSRVKEVALTGGETIMAGKSVLLFKVVGSQA